MSNSNKKVVLVAEDDKFYSQIFKSKLEKEGFIVELALDGEQTLAKIKTRVPDLILLDLVMPIKDGFEVLEAIQADKKLQGAKIIVISNLGQDSDVTKAKALGAHDYFIKSNVSIQEVVAIVRKHVGSN